MKPPLSCSEWRVGKEDVVGLWVFRKANRPDVKGRLEDFGKRFWLLRGWGAVAAPGPSGLVIEVVGQSNGPRLCLGPLVERGAERLVFAGEALWLPKALASLSKGSETGPFKYWLSVLYFFCSPLGHIFCRLRMYLLRLLLALFILLPIFTYKKINKF